MNPEYQSYLRSNDWQEKRILCFRRFGRICFVCGCNDSPLDVHHIRYPKDIYKTKVMDLRPVCRSCHDQVHELIKQKFKWIPDIAKIFSKFVKKMRNIKRKTKMQPT